MVKNLPLRNPILFFVVTISLLLHLDVRGQSGLEFWLAPPEITDLHNSPGGEPLYLFVSSMGQAATVTVEQPANPGFTPIVVNVAADKSVRINLTPFKAQLETRPTNTVLNTGLHITSTATITCFYECANTNNTDIWALKGPNGEGTEFYIPLHKHASFNNEASFASPHQAYASFDICATQNNTVVTIYSPTPVDGHPALQQFSVTLQRGQTYSCGWTGANWSLPSTHPSGAMVLANYPIVVSLKDDSDHNPSGGCYDILGDQIVPTDVVGEDYIAVKGSLNNGGDESVVLMATQNNTQVYVDGVATPIATLFAGEYFRIDMDSLTTSVNNAMYIHCTGPTYAMHISGFGCEMGQAILPPLNCAGSQQLNFVRDDAQTFYVTLLCRSAAINGFTITGGGTATITPASFLTVPGTGGQWKAAKILYNTTQVPVDSTFKVSNSIDVFALGVINGGSTSGCKYGYFSEFVAPITTNAGINQTICANTTATLAGTVSGGTITGMWTSTGTGSFTPNNTTLNAVYTPSAADAAIGSVTLTLTSTGACTPVSDQMLLTITPAPTANAGADQTRCSNNANISLTGAVTVASGGVWTGGAGTFTPGNNVLNPVYTPTAGEITSGNITLTLTTTGNGICNPVSDNIFISFSPSPVVNAGADQTKCGNNAATQLSGSVTVASGGVWTGGGGSFNPSATSLNPIYTPTPAEILSGSITLTLTSTGNISCNAVSDVMTISFSAPPVISAGPDQVRCGNNPAATLAGSVTGASGGQWSGGLGLFSPNNNAPNAIYTATAAEIASGSVTLTYTSTGNGTCNAVNDQVMISFTASPTVNASTDQTVCADNALVTLNGSFTIASGGAWTGGAGTFTPNNTTANASYLPTSLEITNGSATLTYTTTGNGTCNAVADQMTITINPAPTSNAGADQTRCSNNATTTLAGMVTHATGGTWSGGAGTFNPSASSLNATYTPTASEVLAGSIILTLTSTGNGLCNAVSDNMTIFFSSPPAALAGPDQTLCGNNATALLAGNITIASGGQWSGGLGVFTPDNNTLNATYAPSASEIAGGGVALTLTTTGNGGCNAVSDAMIIFFTPAPTVNAGSDVTVCANTPQVSLSGTFNVASGITWTGGNGTFSPNNTSTVATYTPSPGEIAAGTVTLTLTTTGNGNCNAVSDNIIVTISPSPLVDAGLNINACENNATVSLTGQVFNATGGMWSGGMGSFFPNAATLNASYTPSSSEIESGSATLTLTSTGNGTCTAVTDQVTIFFSPAPVSNAGVDQVLCSNNAVATLNGDTDFSTGGQWSGGLGNFAPSPNALGATYTPTAGELSSGSVHLILTTTGNGNCVAVRDTMIVTYTPSPTVDAGSVLFSCANNPAVTLNGSFSVSSGIIWTGGSGSYSPGNTSTNPVYTPSSAEITAGLAILTLTTTGNGSCLPVTDNVIINISPSPSVNAGIDQITCINNLNVGLSGSVSGPTNSGMWTTSGTGTFIPNNTTLNATYQCSATDVTAGSIQLTLTSTSNGVCNAVTDQMTITILPPGTSAAGNDVTVCGNNATVSLNGSVGGGASSGVWGSTGTGSFSPSNSSLNTSYIPSPFDILNGGVTLYLTANSCNLSRDSMFVNITPPPAVSAGIDQVICTSVTSAELDGNVSGGSSTGIWTTTGTGSFSPSNSTLNASYTPSAADIASQNVLLILTSSDNGSCLPATDTLSLFIYPAGTASAGTDQSVCSNNPGVELNGSFGGGASLGIWSTSGSGTFSPDANTPDASYSPSSADIIIGSATLTLTATNSCNNASDALTITFTPAPTADAGSDITSCVNNPSVTLDGGFTVATGAIWSGGNGSFSPGNTNMTAVYSPTVSEVSNGSVTLTLTTDGNGNCAAVNDQVMISFISSPVVNAGADQITCVTDLNIALNGNIQGTSTTGTWTTSGSGSFSPSETALNAVYQFSAADSLTGNVTLTLTSTNNQSCNPVSDNMTITIVPAGTASAGNDVTVCGNNAAVSLNGTVGGGATSGMWGTTGTGSFTPANNQLSTTYTPSAFDISNGGVTVYLTANTCTTTIDSLHITITPAPEANAGADQVICAEVTEVILQGIVSGGSSTGVWTTNGSGTFQPSASDLNAHYMPSQGDVQMQDIQLILTSSSNGMCFPESDTMVLHIYPLGTASAGADQVVCANNPNITLTGLLGGGATEGLWSTTGAGIFIPNNTSLNATYVPGQADLLSGGVILSLTATNSCNNAVDFLSVTFTAAPAVNAGPSQSVCGSNAAFFLNGSVSNATGGTWSGGNGSFSPNNTTLNAIYTPSPEEAATGTIVLTLISTGNGNCNQVADTVSLYISNSILANAGVDQQVCESAPFTQLDGGVSAGSSTGVWTTLGSGSFTPDANALNALYTFSPADLVAGEVTLVLTSTNNGTCSAAKDTVSVTFGNSAFAYAGIDQLICSSGEIIPLHGFVTGGATQGMWSSTGNGNFDPSNTSLDASYTMTASDIANGMVTFTLTSTDNGSCLPGTDTLVYTIVPEVVVSAGGDITLCESDLVAELNGSISGASTSGTWSTSGTGIFTPDNNATDPFYIFSGADVFNENVTLVLTSTNSGVCPADSDTLQLNIHPLPMADAGEDQSLCSASTEITLNGVTSGGTSGLSWTASGNGIFSPNANTANATYTISNADIINGEVEFILTAAGNGLCEVSRDTVVFTLQSQATVNAGMDVNVCAGDMAAPLAGNVIGGAGSGVWSTLGTGTFSPTNTTLSATYMPGAADSLAGSATLILTSTNNGICLPATDTVVVFINEASTASAGNDQSICSSEGIISLNGMVGGGATEGMWNSTGGGSFSPDPLTLNAVYNLTPADIALGEVSLILSTAGSGACSLVSDTVVYTITEGSLLSAGGDVSICTDNMEVPLGGNISGASTTGVWTTTGSGTFEPDNTTLNAMYIPGLSDSLAGSVSLILTSTNTGICAPMSDTLDVSISAPSFANAGIDQTMCSTDAFVQLNGIVTGGSESGVWNSTGTGTFTPANNDLHAVYTPSAADLQGEGISFTLSSTGNGACVASIDVLDIHFIQPPVVNAGSDRVVCGENNEILLGGLVSGSSTTGIWNSNGSGTFTPDNQSLTATYTLSNADMINGEVQLILTSTNGSLCPAEADTLNISVEPMPVAAFSSTSGENLDVQFTDESTGAAAWFWDFGLGGNSTSQDPLFVYPVEGSYEVMMIAYSSGGCTDTTFAMVQALEPIGTPVAIPSGFSPNGDQSNDVLHVLGGPFRDVDFRIYNEWGNLVFSTTDPNSGWDGTYKGQSQPGGVYVYTATGTTIKGRYVKLSGNVTLIR